MDEYLESVIKKIGEEELGTIIIPKTLCKDTSIEDEIKNIYQAEGLNRLKKIISLNSIKENIFGTHYINKIKLENILNEFGLIDAEHPFYQIIEQMSKKQTIYHGEYKGNGAYNGFPTSTTFQIKGAKDNNYKVIFNQKPSFVLCPLGS